MRIIETSSAKLQPAGKRPVSEIEPLAQGRVWLGDQAKDRGLVDELGGIDRAIELVKKKAGIPTTDKVTLAIYPPRKSLFDVLLKSSSDSSIDGALTADALLSRAGLGSLRAVWRDSRLKVLLRGGMLRMMPYSIEFR